MSLERGARIAHYEILGLLGRGGMGEVYRATDTKLNRDVALKLLPEQFTADSDRMERFQREAKLLASLNHSNIAAIYGLEESDRMRALVIELVGGPTLADRIAQGPIPIDELLLIAKQIADRWKETSCPDGSPESQRRSCRRRSPKPSPPLSPDGRWIAYLSDESGRGEVYVRPFPGPGGKWQISTAGGVLPTWSKNGKEIFFEALDKKIMVVNYTVEGESFHAGKPQVWSEATIASAGAVRDFDLHPDGQRFVILKAADTQAQKLDKVTFVFNFADELRKIAPAK